MNSTSVVVGKKELGSLPINLHQTSIRERLLIGKINPNQALDEIAFSNLMSTKKVPIFDNMDQEEVKIRVLLVGENELAAEKTVDFFKSKGVEVQLVAINMDKQHDKVMVKSTNDGYVWNEHTAPNVASESVMIYALEELTDKGFDYVRVLGEKFEHPSNPIEVAKRTLNENGLLFVGGNERQQKLYQKTYMEIVETVANFFDQHD